MPSLLLQWQGGAKRAFLSILSIWVWRRHYPAESTREAFAHSYFLHRLIKTLLSSRHQLLLITVLLMHLWGLLFSYFMTLPDWCLTFRWMSALAPALGKPSLVKGLPGMDTALPLKEFIIHKGKNIYNVWSMCYVLWTMGRSANTSSHTPKPI